MYSGCLESDWKQFCKKVPVWQETYMEKLPLFVDTSA